MANFHSVINRRDFMKALGLVGAGAGAAAAVAPVFRDLDDLVASPTATFPRAWWIKERDLWDITTEYDWKAMSRHDTCETMWIKHSWAKYVGVDKVKEAAASAAAIKKEALETGKPGMDLRATALGSTSGLYNAPQPYFSYTKTAQGWGGGKSFTGQSTIKGPDVLGVPKWQGDPDANLRMLRAALRFYGAAQIGVVPYDTNVKNKLTCVREGGMASMSDKYIEKWPIPAVDARPFVFEDVEKGYETAEKLVIPDKKELFVVSVIQPMSREMWRQGSGNLRVATNGHRYSLASVWQTKIQGFLTTLGYQGLGYPTRAYGPMPTIPGFIFSGLGELGRSNNVCLSPEYGSTHGSFHFLTDLPLTPTKPIDAGMWRFCKTCAICAENCPSQSISYDKEPSWEITPSKYAPNVPVEYSVPGKKVFWRDEPSCKQWTESCGYSCGICMGSCVFNVDNASMIHQVVKGTIATTSLFNGFMKQADKFFGYGLTPESEWNNWWDMNLPAYAFDTTVGVTDGGYKAKGLLQQ